VILQEAIAHHGGQMTKAARALDLERSHLYKKARALGLRGGASETVGEASSESGAGGDEEEDA
jgi:DNA-binding NtrC family response regulator